MLNATCTIIISCIKTATQIHFFSPPLYIFKYAFKAKLSPRKQNIIKRKLFPLYGEEYDTINNKRFATAPALSEPWRQPCFCWYLFFFVCMSDHFSFALCPFREASGSGQRSTFLSDGMRRRLVNGWGTMSKSTFSLALSLQTGTKLKLAR